jgi:HAD superfamily hydrolase (TIGR01459 family)
MSGVTDFPLALPIMLGGVAPLAQHYDGFILDVWGVLHDGVAPYPGVIDTLERLKACAKRVVLLSNAPVRADRVAHRLETLGVSRHLVDGVMSSGEEVWRSLRDRPDPFYAALGRHCLFLGSPRHRHMLAGNGVIEVATPEAADFILDTGPDDLDDTASLYRNVLEAAAARALPMLCANADLHVMHGDQLIVCAGSLAKIYEAMGGRVRWHGKPHGSVYAACRSMLGIAEAARILCIGDSLRTDIAGAAAAGLDSVLVAGGMHAPDLLSEPGARLDPARLSRLLAGQPMPNYVIATLAW